MRRWLWLHFTFDGNVERRAAKRYQAMLDRGEAAARKWAARSRACSPHPNREPNPEATALDPEKYRAERCLDCGVGIVTRLKREDDSALVALRATVHDPHAEEMLDAQETVVFEALRALHCIVPVDPVDPEDCASVAYVAVKALRDAGML